MYFVCAWEPWLWPGGKTPVDTGICYVARNIQFRLWPSVSASTQSRWREQDTCRRWYKIADKKIRNRQFLLSKPGQCSNVLRSTGAHLFYPMTVHLRYM